MENEDQKNQNDSILEQNKIFLCIQFLYPKNTREVAAAIFNADQRKIWLCEFLDNEHFSNFESLLVQQNIQDETTQFQILIQYPELLSEKEKIFDIINQINVKVIEKQKKDFQEKIFEEDISKILVKPLKHYINEFNMTNALQSLTCILTSQGIYKEQSNFKQFQLEQYVLQQYMKLDLAAINALLIFPKANEDGQVKRFQSASMEGNFSTLVDLLDKCKTQIGSRVLRRWLKQPLQDRNEIIRRLDIVQYLVSNKSLREFLSNDFLRKIADLDKLYAKFYKVFSKKRHNCSLQDCIKVYQLVVNLKNLQNFIINQMKDEGNQNEDEVLQKVFVEPIDILLDQFNKLEEMIEKSIDLEKIRSTGEYIVNPSFSANLKSINIEIQKIDKEIKRICKEASEELEINVELIESNTHTFLLEAKKKEVDDAFREKKSRKYKTISVKKGQLDFTTEELQATIAEYNLQKEKYQEEQTTVVQKILDIISTYYPAMEKTSLFISEVDVLCNFSSLVINTPGKPYVRPIINEEADKNKKQNINRRLILKECRHACLEVVDKNCVANDCEMENEVSSFHIITGPNMGGKSTFIRQVAICVLLAHIGCYVPAESAEIPIVDAIITRVGASDQQLRGISTFMSEMLEASCMLNTATEKSLLIIDELGRGTSTSEGFGIAWAISEHIAIQIKCFCLFATHFHEMTQMSKIIKNVKNFHVACMTQEGRLTMQYKVKKGFAARSYGIYVAEILDFPKEIIMDAQKKLLELESFAVEQSNQNQNNNNEEIYNEDDNINNNKIDDFKQNESTEKKGQKAEKSNSNLVGDDELLYLSKNASMNQKEEVIVITREYQDKIIQTKDQGVKKLLINELKDRIVQILQNKQ